MYSYISTKIFDALELIKWSYGNLASTLRLSSQHVYNKTLTQLGYKNPETPKTPYILGVGACPFVNLRDEDDKQKYLNTIHKLLMVELLVPEPSLSQDELKSE